MFVNPNKKRKCESCNKDYGVDRLKLLASNGKYICPHCLMDFNKKKEDVNGKSQL